MQDGQAIQKIPFHQSGIAIMVQSLPNVACVYVLIRGGSLWNQLTGKNKMVKPYRKFHFIKVGMVCFPLSGPILTRFGVWVCFDTGVVMVDTIYG